MSRLRLLVLLSTSALCACSALEDGPSDLGTGAGVGQKEPEEAPICQSFRVPPEPVPLEMLAILDRSFSMGQGEPESRYQAALAAMLRFVERSGLTQLAWGVQLVPPVVHAPCAEQSYSEPWVPLAPAPAVSSELKRRLGKVGPSGASSPLLPAVRGSLAYLQARRQKMPESQSALILFTDGLPNGCGSTVEKVREEIARAQESDPPLRTYVFALEEESLPEQLRVWAQAGGSEDVIFIRPGPEGVAELTESLAEIRREETACEYWFSPPAFKRVLVDSVRLLVHSEAEDELALPRFSHPVHCGEGRQGYTLAEEGSVFRLSLCPASCEWMRSSPKEHDLQVEVGCWEELR